MAPFEILNIFRPNQPSPLRCGLVLLLLFLTTGRLEAAPAVAPFPFEDGFEDGSLQPWWSWSGSVFLSAPPHSGEQAVMLNGDGGIYGKYLEFTIDLAGQSNVWLTFWDQNVNDALDVIMPDAFTGFHDSDGVALSVDGTNWLKVLGLTTTESFPADRQYHFYQAHLDPVLANAGLAFSSTTHIRIQQASQPYQRRYYDDVNVLSQKLELGSNTYLVNEGTNAVVTVLRKGSTAGTVSVDYTTYDQTAVAGQDYTAVSGTLTLADGVASATIAIPIADDAAYSEPEETFGLALSHFVGQGELGSLTNAIFTIRADPRAPVPLIEGFENEPAIYWEKEGAFNGYYVLLHAGEQPHSGTHCAWLQPFGLNPTNADRAVLTINLLGQHDVRLRFWHKTFDEIDAVMPDVFAGSLNADGVALSADGVNWVKVAGLTRPEGATPNYTLHEIALDPILAAHGLAYNQNFKISFQTYDTAPPNTPVTATGTFFDDLSVFSRSGPLGITNETLPGAISMTAYQVQLHATNAVGPVSWTALSPLPEGLSLSPEGVLSGTPVATGSFALDFEVRDAIWTVANTTLVLSVTPNTNQPPVISAREPAAQTLAVSEQTNATFRVTAHDPEGRALTYTWAWDGAPIGADTNVCELTTVWGEAGLHELTVNVSDGFWTSIRTNWLVTVLADNDADGLPNAWENAHGLNPWTAADAGADPDGDALSNTQEFANGTNPTVPDTDGDSLPDGWEVQAGLNPTNGPAAIPDIELTLLGSRDLGSYAYAVDVSGDYAFLAMTEGLVSANVSVPANITGPWTTALSNAAAAVQVAGGFAYVADGNSGLQIVSVSNPQLPQVVGDFDTEGNASDVAVDGSTAYVADGAGGLQVLDVTTPGNPVRLTRVEAVPAIRLAGKDGLLYAAGSASFNIFSVTNPAAPAELGSCATTLNQFNVDAAGHHAFATAGYDGLRVLDLTDNAQPRVLATQDLETYPQAVAVSNGMVFVAATDATSFSEGYLYTLRSDGAGALTWLATNTLPHAPTDLVLVANRLYVCTSWGELFIYAIHPHDADQDGLLDDWELESWGNLSQQAEDDPDGDGVTNLGEMRAGLTPTNADTDGDHLGDGWEIAHRGNPASSTELNALEWVGVFDTAGLARDVAVSGNHAIVADDTNGIYVLDVTDPAHPVSVYHSLTWDKAVDVNIRGAEAFVADTAGGLLRMDISTVTNPVVATQYLPGGWITRSAVAGDYAHAVIGNSLAHDYQIIDLLATGQDAWLGDLATGGNVNAVAASEDFICLVGANSGSKLWTVNATDPAAPALATTTLLSDGGLPRAVDVQGGCAYVADYHRGLHLVDLTNATGPVLQGTYNAGGWAQDVRATGNLAVVVYERDIYDLNADYGLCLLDVRHPQAPVAVLRTNAFEHGEGLCVTSNTIFVAAREAGVLVFRYAAPDLDHDGLSDDWEWQQLGNLDSSAFDDPDGDGLLNLAENEYGWNPANPDQDTDGMADGWELQHSFDIGVADGAADADGDGLSNAGEYQADTDPRDPASTLSIRRIQFDGSRVTLIWQGGVAATQYLEHASSLTGAPDAWTSFYTNAPPTAITNSITIDAKTNRLLFFRLKAERP